MDQLQELEESIAREKANLADERTMLKEDRELLKQDREKLELEKAAMRKLCKPQLKLEPETPTSFESSFAEPNSGEDSFTEIFQGLDPIVHREPYLETVAPPPPMVFSSIKRDLKFSELDGWVVALCKPYSQGTTMDDFKLDGISCDSAVLLGTRKTGEDALIAAAIGRVDVITAPNENQLHNGVYWTNDSGFYIAFTSTPLDSWLQCSCRAGCAHRHSFPGCCLWSAKSVVGTNWEKIVMLPNQPITLGV